LPGVLIYSEDLEVELELVTLATRIGKDVSLAVLGAGDLSAQKKAVSVGGVARIFQVSDDSLKDALTGPVVDALDAICELAAPELVLIGSTKRGKDVAARLAARIKSGCITDALKVQLEGNDVKSERLVWGGNAIAAILSKGLSVATIPIRAFEPATGSSNPNVVSVGYKGKTRGVSVTGKKEKSKAQVSLKDAEVIVSAGRGFKKKEDLAILEELTGVLNGVLGASRPLTSDLGWLPEERQVGLTGTSVKPKLYVAVGISGQIQHLTGMRDSKIVFAINSDKNAPIFQECDYGIVGDLYAVVPALTKELKARLGR
jgi:electron transfer flavoprotein alpha subunit